MSKKATLKPIAAALGTTFAVSLSLSPIANANDNPFSMTELSQGGYMVATSHGDGEGKCGEGKCGEDKEGEGSRGEDKDCEGHCGEDKEGEGKAAKASAAKASAVKTRRAKAVAVKTRRAKVVAVRTRIAKAIVVRIRKAKVNAAKASVVRTSKDNLHLSPDLFRSSAFQAHVSAVFG